MLRIGVNATVFKNPITGVAKRLLALMIALHKINPQIKYFLFSSKDFYLPPLPTLNDSIEKVITPSYNEWFWLHFQIPKLLIKHQIDIFEAPWGGGIPVANFFTKKTFTTTAYQKIKFIFTLHDLIPLEREGFINKMIFKKKLQQQLKHTQLVSVVSKQTEEKLTDFIKKRFNADLKNKIVYAPNGFNPKVFNTQPNLLPTSLKKITKLPPFIFYLGGYNPRKNILALLNGFHKLNQEQNSNLILILAGSKNHYFKKILAPKINLINQEHIIALDYIAEDELPWFYQNCELFVYPSLMEGFGMPILEALACGATVLANKSIMANFSNLKTNQVKHTSANTKLNRFKPLLKAIGDGTILTNQDIGLIKNYTWEVIAEKYYSNCYNN